MGHSVILDTDRLQDKNLVDKLTGKPDRFYLLSASSNRDLCAVIDDLSKNTSDKSALTRVRMAYDIVFDLPTELRRGDAPEGKAVKSLAELLDALDCDECLIVKNEEEYHVVIDDNEAKEDAAAKAVAKLFQQMVFLNLNIDIKLKSEIVKSLIKERFRANYIRFCDQIAELKTYLAAAPQTYPDLTGNGKIRVGNMAESFQKMEEYLRKARQRSLRIVAMGTKKAGKSVIINSLLKRDYAPTSSELPTPNVIRYVPEERDADLTLEYQGKTLTFTTDRELSNYIDNEFKKAQERTGEGSGLEEMIIHYPSEDLNGYEIWDTPGPNFGPAGEKHRKIAEQCIKEADICIFVMNYSNHLADDEVEFLQKIHTTFKEENKFYSLFIAVNRIDERYAAEVEKSVNRILDYIRTRLEDLDYKNILIFGTSALQCFYLDKVLQLLAEDGVVMDGDCTLEEAVRKAKKKHKSFMTPLRFVEDAVKNLEDFHDIEEPDVSTVEKFSGVPQLGRHVRYVGEQKIDTEIVDYVVSSCEMEFNKINNALLVTELVNLRDEDVARLKDLQGKLQGLEDTVDEAMNEVITHGLDKDSDGRKAAKYDLEEHLRDTRREAIKEAFLRSDAIMNNLAITEDELKQLQSEEGADSVRKLIKDLSDIETTVNAHSASRFLRDLQRMVKLACKKIEENVAKAQNKIITKTEEVKKSVSSDSVAGNLVKSFAIPQFPVSLNSFTPKNGISPLEVNDLLFEIAKDATRVITIDSPKDVVVERDAEDIFEWIGSIFGKKYRKTITVVIKESVVVPDVTKFKEVLRKALREQFQDQMEYSHDFMLDDVVRKFDAICDDVVQQCEDISKTYKAIFNTFGDDILNAVDETEEHKKAIENDISVLKNIKAKIQPFFDMWHSILRT